MSQTDQDPQAVLRRQAVYELLTGRDLSVLSEITGFPVISLGKFRDGYMIPTSEELEQIREKIKK